MTRQSALRHAKIEYARYNRLIAFYEERLANTDEPLVKRTYTNTLVTLKRMRHIALEMVKKNGGGEHESRPPRDSGSEVQAQDRPGNEEEGNPPSGQEGR